MYLEEEVNLRAHAKVLLLMVKKVLDVAGVRLSQLDGIVFGEGPGSFTGLRIACSVAKGLAYAHDLPLYPVSSLFAIATRARGLKAASNVPVLAMMDARMRQVYWAYEPKAQDEQAYVTDAAEVTVPHDAAFVLAGAAFQPYIDVLPDAVRADMVDSYELYPRADAMIECVQAGDIQAVSVDNAAPMYVRQQVTGGGKTGG